MKKTAISLVAVLTGLISFESTANSLFTDRISRPYVGFNIGVNQLGDTNFNFDTGVDVDSEYDNGVTVTGEYGYNFGKVLFISNVKLGLEVGYNDNEVDQHNIPAIAGVEQGSVGDLKAVTYLANMYHEYNTGTRFVPYYGIGVGLAKVEAENFGVTGVSNALNDDDTAFMYQVTAGLNYIISSDVDFGARYRYAATDGLELTGSGAGAQARDFDYENHNLTVNLTYNF